MSLKAVEIWAFFSLFCSNYFFLISFVFTFKFDIFSSYASNRSRHLGNHIKFFFVWNLLQEESKSPLNFQFKYLNKDSRKLMQKSIFVKRAVTSYIFEQKFEEIEIICHFKTPIIVVDSFDIWKLWFKFFSADTHARKKHSLSLTSVYCTVLEFCFPYGIELLTKINLRYSFRGSRMRQKNYFTAFWRISF